jgi:hypothetical protein
MGKTIQTKSEYDSPANMVASDTYYDLMGRVARQSNPYLADSAMGYSAPDTAIPATQTGYDILGRSNFSYHPSNQRLTGISTTGAKGTLRNPSVIRGDFPAH